MEQWKIINETKVFASAVFSLIKKECLHPVSGVKNDFYTIDTLDWINVVARTEAGEYILVRQHRLGNGDVTVETPGGLMEPGELPDRCAKRELLEETGYSCDRVHLLKKLTVNPAIMNNSIYIYFAPNCIRAGEQQLDVAEDIDSIILSELELREMLNKGGISHSIVVMALNLYFSSSFYDG